MSAGWSATVQCENLEYGFEHCYAVRVKSGNETTGCWFLVCSLILHFELISTMLGWLCNTEHRSPGSTIKCVPKVQGRSWKRVKNGIFWCFLLSTQSFTPCNVIYRQLHLTALSFDRLFKTVQISLHLFRNQKPKVHQIRLWHRVDLPLPIPFS